MIHEQLTGKILEGCFEVSKELGTGFLESVYEKSLIVALAQKNLRVEAQVPLKVAFRGVVVGDFYADLLVEGMILVEIKAVDSLNKQHYSQILNYLKTTGLEVGLIVNFGNQKLEYRRFENRMRSGNFIENLLNE